MMGGSCEGYDCHVENEDRMGLGREGILLVRLFKKGDSCDTYKI